MHIVLRQLPSTRSELLTHRHSRPVRRVDDGDSAQSEIASSPMECPFLALFDRYCVTQVCRALQENFVEMAVSGLASMYQASDWSACSWPSWISARVRSH